MSPVLRAYNAPPSDLRWLGMATITLGGFAVPEAALTWKFVRSSGPGGQNVNKVATAAECRLHLDRACLPAPVRRRLEVLAGQRLTAGGEVVVLAEDHRTQARNRGAALERLEALLEAAGQAPKRRIPSQPSAAQKARRRDQKQRRSEIKQQRRPPDY